LTLFGSLPSFSCPRSPAAKNSHVEQSSEVPFELYHDNLIVVKGSIELAENVNIVLDTGTNPTAISTEIASRLNLRGNTEPLLSSRGQIDVQTAILPRIDIGALHLRSARVVVQDLRFMQRNLGISIAAVAGLDVLRTSSFMIDYGKRRILFAPAQAPKKSVPFERQSPYLTVSAKIGGDEFRLLVDSGTPGLLLFHNRLNRKAAKLERLANDPNAPMFTAAGAMRAEWFRASEVWLGTQSIGPQIMLVADGDPDPGYEFDGLLGFAKTGFQKVWLDFEHGLFGWN
jgi:predicted aspartyl protease